MPLPVTLHAGWCSMIASPSLNGITGDINKVRFGYVNAVSYLGNDGTVSVGQYGMFKVTNNLLPVTYQGVEYNIVKEEDIIFNENPVLPLP